MSDKFTIEIDGRACDAAAGEMIIAVADREGIPIPRFCYHEKLSIAANCRMCLVEAEQGGRPFPKPVPACATPVNDGMKVRTRSRKALDAQRGTMEFLLINHPLDCPICDQGGECELQDVSMGYGDDVSRFSERKRVVKDEDLGPLIATEMTRCIHCTRCVRFGAEIAGVRELGATGRGEDMRIGTYIGQAISHELFGNVIDLCPVGALTAKPYRFTARAWELTGADGVSPHDGVGANIVLHVRGDRVMRVHPRSNESVNETWISDRDRFSYEGLNSNERLVAPMIKNDDGSWREADWQEALQAAATVFKVVGSEQLGCLVGPWSTLEEQYLCQKLLRALGSSNIDMRLRRGDFRGDAADPALPWLGLPIADLETQSGILLIGSDIRQEQPLLAHRIRKAALAGGRVVLLSSYQRDLNHAARVLLAAPGRLTMEMSALAKVLGEQGTGGAKDAIDRAEIDDRHRSIADDLRSAGAAGTGLVLLGALAEADPDYALIRNLARLIADGSGCRLGFLPSANSTGGWLAGAVPHRLPGGKALDRPGLDCATMTADPRQGYLLWNLEPDRDPGDPSTTMAALRTAEHVVACTLFRSSALESVATVMLPIAGFAETAGTLVNAEGLWQRFQGVVPPPGDARPGWKVLRVLGNLLDLQGFDFISARQVHDEVKAACADLAPDNTPLVPLEEAPMARLDSGFSVSGADLVRVGNVPIYAIDPIVRHAPALQSTPLAESLSAQLHPEQARELGINDGDEVRILQSGIAVDDVVIAKVVLDDAVAFGAARVAAGVDGSERLGAQIGPIRLEAVSAGVSGRAAP